MADSVFMTDKQKKRAAENRKNIERARAKEARHGKNQPAYTKPLTGQADPKHEVVFRDGMSYADYLRTPHWIRTRNRAVHNADGRCESCGIGYNLQVHHLTYDRVGKERFFDIVVLCRACHTRIHELG